MIFLVVIVVGKVGRIIADEASGNKQNKHRAWARSVFPSTNQQTTQLANQITCVPPAAALPAERVRAQASLPGLFPTVSADLVLSKAGAVKTIRVRGRGARAWGGHEQGPMVLN